MTTTEPLDYAAIKVEHRNYDGDCAVCEPWSLVEWPCLTYRFAVEAERLTGERDSATQALWDVRRELGFDNDNDEHPGAAIAGSKSVAAFAESVVRDAVDHRRECEADADSLWSEHDKQRDRAERLAGKLARVEALLGEPQVPIYDAENGGSFEGFASGRRQDHRTVGPHRAWSDAGEWCYPSSPCSWCEQKIEPADLRDALADQLEQETHA